MSVRLAGVACIVLSLNALAQVTITPQQVNMGAVAGSTTPTGATISVLSQQNLSYDVGIRYVSGTPGWLSVTPTTGILPANLTLSANPTNLLVGTYQAQITVTAGPLHVGAVTNVTFTVGTSSSGGSPIVVNPTGLTFAGPTAGDPQTLNVQNAPGVSTKVSFTTTSTSAGNWLLVSQSASTVPATVTVRAIQGSVPAGTYNGTVNIVPTGGPATIIPVTFVSSGSSSGSATLALTLTQPVVNINHQVNTTVPAPQVVGVDTTTGVAVLFTATSNATWCLLTSPFFQTPSTNIADFAPGNFKIVLDPTNLVPGTYTTTVTVASFGLTPIAIPVTLNVSTTAALNVNPSYVSLDLSAEGVGIPISVTSTGTSNLVFTTVVSSAPWLTLSPPSGSTGGGQTVNLLVDFSGLPLGTVFNGTITFTITGTSTTLVVPVRLTTSGSAAGGTLQVSPSDIDFAVVAGSTNPQSFIAVRTSGAGTLPYNVSAQSTGGWLSVSPTTSTAPSVVSVTANANLPVGAYTGSVTFTSLRSGAQTTVDVTLLVSARLLAAAPAALSFVQVKRGVSPAPQQVQITANLPSSFVVSNRSSWITVTPNTLSTPATLTVSVDPTGLPSGNTSGSITLTGPNTLTIPVTVTVPDLPSPTATPAAINVVYQYGSPAPKPQTINVGSTGDILAFTTTATTDSGIDWLNVVQSPAFTPATLTVNLLVEKLVPGTYSGTIRLVPADAGAKTVTIPVSVRVAGSPIQVRDVVSAASFAPTSVSPGQLISITGIGLGPQTGVIAKPSGAGSFDTTLGGMQVLFDGVLSPLLFVQDGQINAIVPYSLYGRTNTRMQVQSGTNFSLPIDLKVADSAPSIFVNATRTQAAALNADNSINSILNPVARGSVIVVFGTGEGQTDPPGQDGRVIATDIRKPLLPVSAKIGGKTALVIYLGSAPTLVAGVFQANIVVPDDIPSGTTRIEIQIGSATTQSGVTIEVR